MQSLSKERLAAGDIVRTILVALFIFGILAVVGERSLAEDWPERPVKIVVGFPPGGTIDIIARELAQKFSESFRQSFYVENRPGASGNSGTDYVAKSARDGYTLLMGSEIQFAIAPNFDSTLPYKVNDFAPISLVAIMDFVLAAHPSLAANNVRELVTLAKEQPGKINYGSAGPGSTHELAMEQLQQRSGFKLTEIPYRGTGQALPDLLSGRIQVMLVGVAAGLPYLHSGQLKALAVGTLERIEALPEVPTIAEQGFPDFEATVSAGLYAPAETPKEIIAQLQQETARIIHTPEMRELLLAGGSTPIGSTSDVLLERNKRDSAKWARVLHDMRGNR
jgi:tripartite-type tricarboxylate transporter receptor subunit TctC